MRIGKHLSHVVLGGLATLAAISAGSAQETSRSQERGFWFGALLNPALINTDKYISDSTARFAAGIGLGVQAGYDFPPGLTAFIRAEDAIVPRKIGTYQFRNIDYGARWRFPGLRKIMRNGVPYAEVAFTNRMIVQNNVKVEGRVYSENGSLPFPSIEAEGIQWSWGAGVNLPLRKRVQLNAGLSHTVGTFNSIRFAGGPVDGWDFKGSDFRLHLGLTWRPQKSDPDQR